MIQITIDTETASQRLDKFLRRYLPEAGSGFLYKQLRKKNITLNGTKATGKELLQEGDEIRIFFSDETLRKFSAKESLPQKNKSGKTGPSLAASDILFEDSHVLILNKKAGILSQKAAPEDISLVEMIQSYLTEKGELTEESLRIFRPSVVNRIDRNTSGIVLAAKTLAAARELSECLRDRTVHKYYYALTEGEILEPARISAYLTKDPRTNRVTVHDRASVRTSVAGAVPSRTSAASIPDNVQILDAKLTFAAEGVQNPGEYIETEYTPAEHFRITDPHGQPASFTLLKVKLITGKTHQIRSHLSFIGHPIIGDVKYGLRNRNEDFRKSFGLRRQFLHASELVFPPMNGVLSDLSGRTFQAPLPDDLRTTLKKLEAANRL
ncbi:RluA family pseudouridine synthase [Bilifractor sp. LCP19S3_H10]|uniref:RluA family pseudouridine synthase n=1 Tax=Bilifractor sp. LCP19S3_H10 TaxID=3438736 RepID=UPI003F91BC70